MKLKDLLEKIKYEASGDIADVEVTDVCIDSRQAKEGSLFVAVKGTVTDGHLYIDKAIANGAVAILCQHLPEERKQGVVYAVVKDTEPLVGIVASRLFGEPSTKMKLVGVTGTNGKTTTATVLYKLFKHLGHKVGLLSTVCNYVDDEAVPADHTTPDPVTLNKLLARMVDAGCEYAFMEVSSHAVAQHRIAGLRFAGGIFTNLTRDHLDYHKTFDNYLKAKKQFFDSLPKGAFALTNDDDRNGRVMVQNTKAKVYTYSRQTDADFKADVLESHFEGMLLMLNGQEVAVQFVGSFNVSNLLAVYGAAVLLGVGQHDALLGLSLMKPVSGRFETLRSPDGYTAIVDYAHTPDALVNVLETIHDVLDGRGSVTTVVGAGGNRDHGKRPMMAHEAARLSDRLIITSDNPRNEDPMSIINDMLAGLTEDEKRCTVSIPDRREAIAAACRDARKGDVVLVAGKGHENYQEIMGVKHHFDDKEVLLDIFKSQI